MRLFKQTIFYCCLLIVFACQADKKQNAAPATDLEKKLDKVQSPKLDNKMEFVTLADFENKMEFLYAEGEAAFKNKNYKSAYNSFKAIDSMSINQQVVNETTYKSQFNIGTIESMSYKNNSVAIVYLNKSLEGCLDQQIKDCFWKDAAYSNLAYCHFELGEFEASIAASNKVNQNGNQYSAALANICFCYGKMNQYEEAAKYCKQAKALDNVSATVWLNNNQTNYQNKD